MRIFLVETDGLGGMVHYAYQMATALAEAGGEVTLLTSPHYELAHLPHRFEVETRIRVWPNVEPDPTPAGRLRRLWRFARHKARRVARAVRFAWEWERLTRFLIREQPDVVQFAIIRFPFQAFFLSRMRRAGLYLSQVCHEFEPRERRLPVIRHLSARRARAVYPNFRAIFLHGPANRDRFLSMFPVDPERTHLIPHGDESLFLTAADAGGDLRDHYGIAAETPVALFFGGLRPSKGIPDLIDAFALALQETSAHLVIAGYPTTEVDPGAFRRRVEDLGIGAAVTVDPRYLPLEEVGPLLRTATVAVLPYRSATASGVLQVAYAFGRPVIATDTGDLATAIVPGRTGLLVPPHDPPALARALVEVLSDPDAALTMGASGRRLAEQCYDWAPIAEHILQVYSERVAALV
jgi:glycosyltransferase involved in cell wall biosynthesis